MRRCAVAEQRPQARPQTVGTDQRGAVIGLAARDVDADAPLLGLEPFDLGAERESGARVGGNSVEQRLLQVGAVDHPVRCAIASLHRLAEGNADDLAAGASGREADRLRHHDCGGHRSARPSAIRTRVAFGESWMPAPASSSRSA